MSRFRHLLFLILGFAMALMAGELALRMSQPWLPRPSVWPTVETELKHQQLNSGENYDVVFLGSSVTEAAVDPDQLGLSAYNAALPFSSPISLRIWFEGEFQAQNAPSVVVLGLPIWPSHDVYEGDTLAAPLTSAFGTRVDVHQVRMLRNRGVLADWFDLRSRNKAMVSALWTDRGHQTVYYERSGGTLVGRFPPYGTPSMSAEAEAAIRSLATYVDSLGARFVIMVEPGRFPGIAGPELTRTYLASLENLATSLDVPFWNTHSLAWDPMWFADEAHFNRKGTLEFTALMSRKLAELNG